MRLPEDVRKTNTIEIYIQAWRIAEALAVGRAFANALGASSETTLSFAFRWSGIKNREIDLWAHPGAEFISARASVQDISQCEVNIASSTNDERLHMDPKFEETTDILNKGGFVTELVTPPDQAHFGNWVLLSTRPPIALRATN